MDKNDVLNSIQDQILKNYPVGWKYMLDIEGFVDIIPCDLTVSSEEGWPDDFIDPIIQENDIKTVMSIIAERTIANLKGDPGRIIALFAYGEYLCDYDDKGGSYKKLFHNLLDDYISTFGSLKEENDLLIGKAIWNIEKASIVNLRDSKPAINITDILKQHKYFDFSVFSDRDYSPVSLNFACSLLSKCDKNFFYNEMIPVMKLKKSLNFIIKKFKK